MGKFFTVATPENTALGSYTSSSASDLLPEADTAAAISILALADAAAYRSPALYILCSPVSRLQIDIAALTMLALILLISVINLFR